MRKTTLDPRKSAVMVAALDALAAADRASALAIDAHEWAAASGAGADDAAEASRAAGRARQAAEHAAVAGSEDEALDCARLAWAAAGSAEEASARVGAAIAELAIQASARRESVESR
jgi:hypothetical protein